MPPRIVYLSWPAKEITGGIKMVFRHVEMLCEAGFDAVVGMAQAVPPTWFETTAPITEVTALLPDRDVLVFPENHFGLLKLLAEWPNRKVVFCQGQFIAFRGLGDRRDYAEFGVSAILAVGRQTAEFCRRRFPSLPVEPVPVYVDRDRFGFQSEKRLQIAYDGRKRPQEAGFLRDLFRAENPQWHEVPWVEIAGASEVQVAGLLKDSATYLALCRLESLPLSILEAMACGCVVAGFTGFGARDYTTAANGFWAEEDDLLDCADQLANAVQLVTAGGGPHAAMLEAAHVTAAYYSRERLAHRLVEFWRGFLREGG